MRLTLEERRDGEKWAPPAAAFWGPTRTVLRGCVGPPVRARGTLQKPTETVEADLRTWRLENPPLFQALFLTPSHNTTPPFTLQNPPVVLQTIQNFQKQSLIDY